MTDKELISCLTDNLTAVILPYWENRMVDPRGGFYGRRDGFDRLDAEAPKGAILNGRLLWTFSAAYRLTGDERYRSLADRAFDYITAHFIDREFGGVYWSLNADGTPSDTKKQFYAIAFVIYGLAEYARATGSEKAVDEALALFATIEGHSRDRGRGGYIEAATRDWRPIADMRLSDKDENSSKTMNTHLHIIEAYTALLRVCPDNEALREATIGLLRIFLERIEDPESHHLLLFFDDDWNPSDRTISYGHDIEASWLLLETAMTIGDPGLIEETMRHTHDIADAALEGRCCDGAMIYERHPDGHYDNERHWWVQAECVVGQVYLALFHRDPKAMDMAVRTLEYIGQSLVDRENGEWYWSRLPDGSINRTDDKAGFWKCPYHNGRMCIEVIERLSEKSDRNG